MNKQLYKSMGWRKDYPDFRDFTPLTNEVTEHSKKRGVKRSVKDMLQDLGLVHGGKLKKTAKKLPAKMDLRDWCSPIENQGDIGSCTAHAVIGLLEYYERKAFGIHIDASRLFLYKATRNLLHWKDDDGAYLRTAMGALALFGAPPEEYWPYEESKFNHEPTAFCYSFAQNYKAISYYRIDELGIDRAELLVRIKEHLANSLPMVFGFTVYKSIAEAELTGAIPFPSVKDKVEGGHAVMAIGYDDTKKIKNKEAGSKETVGAILIRNSWGDWGGQGGYLWLPYDYILKGLAEDWWTLIKNEWIETGKFGE
jgi:C1A family cysteine protease